MGCSHHRLLKSPIPKKRLAKEEEEAKYSEEEDKKTQHLAKANQLIVILDGYDEIQSQDNLYQTN